MSPRIIQTEPLALPGPGDHGQLPGIDPIFTDADFQSTVLERPIGGQPGSLRTVHQQCTGADSVQSCICGLRNSYLGLLVCEGLDDVALSLNY